MYPFYSTDTCNKNLNLKEFSFLVHFQSTEKSDHLLTEAGILGQRSLSRILTL